MDLVNIINNSLRESDFPTPKNGYFASRSTLRHVTEFSVTNTIWSNPESLKKINDSDRKLVEFISWQSPEIFAIGVYMGIDLKNMMSSFMMHGKSDKSLPISDTELEKMWPEPQYQAQRRQFQDAQHIFRAQRFPMQNRFSVIQLQPKVVLPILRSEHKSQGRFGIVYKVTLHKDFLDSNDPIHKVRQKAACCIVHGALPLYIDAQTTAQPCVCHLWDERKSDRHLMLNLLRRKAWPPSRNSESPSRVKAQNEPGRGRSRP